MILEKSSSLKDESSRIAGDDGAAFSSSPGFATPAHTIIPRGSRVNKPSPKHMTLPILLPPSILRPIAFRVLTKKHNLTINSATLQTLATFVGKHCGSKWRENGSAERVLEEIARIWKANGNGGMVEDGENQRLTSILRALEGSEKGGKEVENRSAVRQRQPLRTTSSGSVLQSRGTSSASTLRIDSQGSAVGDEVTENDDPTSLDVRSHIEVIDAFEQPRLVYNVSKVHFDVISTPPSLFATPSERTSMIRDRYNLVQQRLFRNEVFYMSSFTAQRLDSNSPEQGDFHASKLTAIANLLGRSGSSHYVLGMLTKSPAGGILLSDLTGSVCLDLHHARSVPEDGAWYTPGMFIIAYGVYEENEVAIGEGVTNNQGIGGAIGGKLFAVFIAGPPCERRESTMGMLDPKNPKAHIEGGFGWVDFLGLGSELGIGAHMRQLERRCLQRQLLSPAADRTRRRKIVILSEVVLNAPAVINALDKVLRYYNDDQPSNIPPCFVFLGNFIEHSGIWGSDLGGSTEYKDNFDTLASVLSRFPNILRGSTFVFVPGDNDPWAATHSAGASAPIPRGRIPVTFTSQVNRAFHDANRDASDRSEKLDGKVIWASNPARLCLFGPAKEVVMFRDDMSGRLRRNALLLKSGSEDQGAANDVVGAEIEETELIRVNGITSIPGRDNHQTGWNPHHGAGINKSQTPAGNAASRKLVKTILDQGHLSPFPLTTRPVLGSFASVLSLYPLPSALILADSEADPFALTYEGCHVMNPGRLVPEGSKCLGRWIEYDILKNRGRIIQDKF
ncbi:DNA-directed DNA polymerase epsilon, subunit B [Ascosphaera aggregata]|nr:DNA-directed DNA polymerase epsilon, subunit B [Ascosphaera aggregata]